MSSPANYKELLSGYLLFLNRAWIHVSPDSTVIPFSKLFRLYCIYIRLGSLKEPSEHAAQLMLMEAISEIWKFWNAYHTQVTCCCFHDIEFLVNLFIPGDPVLAINLTREQAAERTMHFWQLDPHACFKSVRKYLTVDQRSFVTEPPSSGYEDGSSDEDRHQVELRMLPSRDLLSEMPASDSTRNNYLVDEMSSLRLASPIHLESPIPTIYKEYDDDESEYTSEWSDEDWLYEFIIGLD